jgi:GNAT superfamily N-acetyltransferase
LELRELGTGDVEEAGTLLAARHRAQCAIEPSLPAQFEEPDAAAAEIESLRSQDGATGVVARRDGRLVGYLVGTSRDDVTWGPNTWIEPAGHAVEDAESVRDLYAAAAASFVEAGRTSHHVVVPATDPALVDAWFRVGFGHQHVHAVRESPGEGEITDFPAHLTIRRAGRDDIEALARLELALPEHQALSPVFSRLALPTLEEARREWDEDWDDPRFTTFVAEHGNRVIGSAIACSVEASSLHVGLTRPQHAGFLGFAAVAPEARGLGAGRALGEAVLEWARIDGYPAVVTDWRMTNLLSSRTWPRLGFRPTFYRLHRAIA